MVLLAQGGFCTKSLDDVIPDQTNGGLAAHTVLTRRSSRKLGEEAGMNPIHNLGWSESKKDVSRAKTLALLDAVQEQRAKQQAAGVQRLHDRALSMKLQNAQNHARASFRSRSVDFGLSSQNLLEQTLTESFKNRSADAEEASTNKMEDYAAATCHGDDKGIHRPKPARMASSDSQASKESTIAANNPKACSFHISSTSRDYQEWGGDSEDPKELSVRSNPERSSFKNRQEGWEAKDHVRLSHARQGSFKVTSSANDLRHEPTEEKETSIRSNPEKHSFKNRKDVVAARRASLPLQGMSASFMQVTRFCPMPSIRSMRGL
jgi:hypothetical protein